MYTQGQVVAIPDLGTRGTIIAVHSADEEGPEYLELETELGNTVYRERDQLCPAGWDTL